MISKTFTTSLLKWYNANKRDLPWRHTKDPYHIWVSEMMLQQTTVAAVIPYFQRWFAVFPTVNDLAEADEQKVLKAWQGLGYYSRARNLHKAARIVVDSFDGVLPKDPKQVRALPGFGPYATAAVLSIAYDVPLALVDANVRRVMMRVLAIEGVATPAYDQTILDVLQKILPKQNTGDFNQAMMELGATVCRSKEPICGMCPLKKMCKAYDLGVQELIPQTLKRTITSLEAVIAIIQRKDQYFIQQRKAKGLLANLWEFPGGKIEKGETPLKALQREVREELGVGVQNAKHLFNVTHAYTQFKVNLHVFSVDVDGELAVSPKALWVKAKDFQKYPMPSGSAKICERLAHLKKNI